MCFGDDSMPAAPPPPPAPDPIKSAAEQAAIANEAVRKRNLDDASRRGVSSLRIGNPSNSTGLIITPS